MLTGEKWATLLRAAACFAPHAVLLDGLFGYATASRLARMLGAPLSLRSHNIEHRYLADQARFAGSLRERFILLFSTIGMRRFESRALRRCSWVYDISSSDLEHWRRQGISRISWLPPMVQVPDADGRMAGRTFDILFLGNLHTPNNVMSVRWLLTDIFPRIRARLGEVSLCVAGSNPTAEIAQLCRAAPGVELMADPATPWPLYRAARVLVNPATSGSGVQIKTVEMLHCQIPVVTTSVGAQGLPGDVKALLSIADDAADFAEAVVAVLAGPIPGAGGRVDALRIFGIEQLRHMVRRLSAGADDARQSHD